MADDELIPLLFTAFDYVWNRQGERLRGLTTEEYLWQLVEGGWTVRAGEQRWTVDANRPVERPVPVPTIAWRVWHNADCLASYVAPHLGGWPLPVRGGEWYGEVAPAIGALDTSYTVFRERMVGLGEDGLRRPLGPAWGPYASEPWSALVLHAFDEVVHHGAEIALLRDLYGRIGPPDPLT